MGVVRVGQVAGTGPSLGWVGVTGDKEQTPTFSELLHKHSLILYSFLPQLLLIDYVYYIHTYISYTHIHKYCTF